MRCPNGVMTSTLEVSTAADTGHESPVRRGRLGHLTRDRVALGVLLMVTAVTYLWNITVNGMGNQFYAGAAWAGSRNWKALLLAQLTRTTSSPWTNHRYRSG